MTIDLYHIDASGPCRMVRLAAAAIGIDLNLKFVDLMKKDQLKPEYLKINPQHTVPTLDDNGFYLPESRAICMYLADKYGKDDSLYPKDLQKRAIVNQRLFFDADTLYVHLYDYYAAPIWEKAPKDPSKLDKIHESLEFLEKFLESGKYVAGDKLTIADIAIITTLSTYVSVYKHDISKYKNTSNWFTKVKSQLPRYEEINETGLQIYRKILDEIRGGN